MNKVKAIDDDSVWFFCPGCNRYHLIRIVGEVHPRWEFNGDYECPTLSPSILVKYKTPKGYSDDNPAPPNWKGEYEMHVCHSFVKNGDIQFLNDCTHKLAGTTIELPDCDNV